jgi:hypothetical protein
MPRLVPALELVRPLPEERRSCDAPPRIRLGVAGCRLVEQNASSHDVRAAPDGDGILVSCTCGWRAWSPTSAAPASLLAAQQQLGGEHLADVHAPIPPRGEVFWAFGIFVVLVCVTVVVVYLIWSW